MKTPKSERLDGGQDCYSCGNCFTDWVFADLNDIANLLERVDVGGEVPAGECPECGALCYARDYIEATDAEVKAMAEGIAAQLPPDKRLIDTLVTIALEQMDAEDAAAAAAAQQPTAPKRRRAKKDQG